MTSLLGQCLLFPTFCRARIYSANEERKIRRAFYHNESFRKSDQQLKDAYRGLNPYTLSKQFLKQKGESDIHLYGETPLTTLYEIACRFGISSRDHVIDIGCGRGRGINFLRHYIGCQVTGVEWHPIFAEKSVKGEKSQVICCDFLDMDFKEASVIYFYGTSFSDAVITQLAKSFELLDNSVKLITVSYPLSDYNPNFGIEARLKGSFPWGKADIFLNRLVRL